MSIEVPNLKSWETPLANLIENQLLVISDKQLDRYLKNKGSNPDEFALLFFEPGRLA